MNCGDQGVDMDSQSEALAEWRRQTRKSWRRAGVGEKRVVHHVRTAGVAGRMGDGQGWPVARFLVLAAILVGCLAWLLALIGH